MSPRDPELESNPDLLRHAQFARGVAKALLFDGDRAEDAVQDAWLQALQKPPRDRAKAGGWFAQVARNFALRRLRGDARRLARERAAAMSEVDSGSADAAEASDRAAALRAVTDAVLELGEPYRGTVLRRYYEGASPRAIAAATGVPVATVKSRLQRALAELRHRLDRQRPGQSRAFALALFGFVRPEGAAAAVALGVKTGVWLVKAKTAVAAALAVLGAIGAWLFWSDSGAPARGDVERGAEVRAVAGAPVLSSPAGRAPEVEREPAASPSSAPAPASPAEAADAEPEELLPAGVLEVEVVFASDGGPGADVGVKLWPVGLRNPFGKVRRGVTDERGIARFEGVPTVRVGIYADRRASEFVEPRAGEGTRVRLTVAPGMTIRGKVLDEADRPVAGARIWLSSYGNDSDGNWVARADEAGRFELRDVGEFGYCIAAGAPGRPTSGTLRVQGLIGETQEVALRLHGAGCTVSGRVADASGQPVAGAFVQLQAKSVATDGFAKRGQSLGLPPCLEQRTGSDGTFSWSEVPAGPFEVEVRADGLAAGKAAGIAAPESPVDLAIQLEDDVRVVGRILDPAGRPAAEAMVAVGPYGELAASMSYTLDDGSFELDGIAPGSFQIRADGDRGGTAAGALSGQAGQTLQWNATLGFGRTLAGRVVDERGAPLASWVVQAFEFGKVMPQSWATARSRADGTFELIDIPGATVRVTASGGWSDAIPGAELKRVALPSPPLELVIKDARRSNATAKGALRDPAGAPVGGFVFLEIVGGPLLAELGRSTIARASAVAGPTTGAFELDPVPAGRYRVWGQADSFGRQPLGEFEFDAHETTDLGELTFAGLGTVLLNVDDAGGAPPVLAQRLAGDGSATSQGEMAERGEGGAFLPLRLPPGRYRVSFVDDEAGGEIVDVVTDGEVAVALQRKSR